PCPTRRSSDLTRGGQSSARAAACLGRSCAPHSRCRATFAGGVGSLSSRKLKFLRSLPMILSARRRELCRTVEIYPSSPSSPWAERPPYSLSALRVPLARPVLE